VRVMDHIRNIILRTQLIIIVGLLFDYNESIRIGVIQLLTPRIQEGKQRTNLLASKEVSGA